MQQSEVDIMIEKITEMRNFGCAIIGLKVKERLCTKNGRRRQSFLAQ